MSRSNLSAVPLSVLSCLSTFTVFANMSLECSFITLGLDWGTLVSGFNKVLRKESLFLLADSLFSMESILYTDEVCELMALLLVW